MKKVKKKIITEARRAYLKEWRKKNPDKVRSYQERFWLKKAEEYLARQKEGE